LLYARFGVSVLYGAVTAGQDWWFCLFNREMRRVAADFKLLRVPKEMKVLLRVLARVSRSCEIA